MRSVCSRPGAAELAAGATIGFAALAALVATGATNGLDQWAIDHAMPGAHFGGGKPTTAEGIVPLLHVRWHGTVHVLAEIVTLPAAFLPSLLLLVVLRRFAWLVPWVAGTAVEGLCKLTLTRPGLDHDGLHLAAFDNSYPSGHTLRAVILAAAIPRRGRGPSQQSSCSSSAASTCRPTSSAGCCSAV